MASSGYKYEYWEGTNGKWYWHWKSPNGEVTKDGGQGYSTRQNARRSIRSDWKRGSHTEEPVMEFVRR